MDSIDFKPFLTLRRHLRIAHHIPGRIRLRIDGRALKGLGRVDPARFDRVLSAVDGIKDVRVNAAAGSVVIAYVPTRIEPSWWETLVQGDDHAALELLTRLLDDELAGAVEAARGD